MRLFTNRGQMEMQEMILVLFFIILLIAVGMFFYYRYSVQHIEERSQDLEEQGASVLLTSIVRLGEIRCEDDSCLDTSKFVPFSLLTHDSSYYFKLFGDKTIRIVRVYPEASSSVICTSQLYNQAVYPDNCDTYVLYQHLPKKVTQKVILSTPVSLYYPEIDRVYLGRLELETY